MVDPYVRPGAATIGAPDRRNQWHELADALRTINPSLQRFLKTEFDEQTEEVIAEGEAQQKRDKLTFREAVRKGVIPEGANPFLKLGYMKGDLRVKGQEYQSWLMEEWQKDGDIQNASPDAIPDWMAAKTSMFHKERLQGIDARLVKEVFDPAAERGQNRLLTHHVSESFRRTEEQAREVLQRELTNILESKYSADPLETSRALTQRGIDISSFTSEDDMSQALIARSISDLLKENVSNGMNGTVANQLAIGAVASIADMEGDLSLLDVLDNIQTNTGTLGGLAEANQAKLRVSDRIVSRKLREEQLYWQRKERREAEEEKQVLSSFFDLAKEAHDSDGLQAIDPFLFIEENNITNPGTRAEILRWTDRLVSALDRDVSTNDEYVSRLLLDMHLDENFDPRRIQDGSGINYDVEVEMRLWDDWRSVSSRKQRHTVLDDPRFKRIVRETGDAVKSAIGGGFGAEALNASDAQLDIEDAAASFLQKNPEATNSEFYGAMRDARNDIVGHYNKMATDLGRVQPPDTEDEPVEEPTEAPAEEPAETAPEQTGSVEPPSEAVAMLMASPNQETIAQFDEVFGQGAAARVLAESQQQEDQRSFLQKLLDAIEGREELPLDAPYVNPAVEG